MTVDRRAATRVALLLVLVAGLSGAISYGVATSVGGEAAEASAPTPPAKHEADAGLPRARNRAERITRLRELASGPEEAGEARAAALRADIEVFAEANGGSPAVVELRCAVAGPCLVRLDHLEEHRARENNAAIMRRKLVQWEGPMISATVSSTMQDLFLIDSGLVFDGRDLVPAVEVERAARAGKYPAGRN